MQERLTRKNLSAFGPVAGLRCAPLPLRSLVVISTNQFKNGNHIEVDGTIFKILEFQHVKPGKGGAFVRTKLRRASDGNVIDRTFRAGEKFRSGAHRVAQDAVPLRRRHATRTSWTRESFEQIAVPETAVAEPLRWMTPSSEVDVLFIDGEPADMQLPSAVDLEVTETDPGLRGDSVSGGGTKPATLETGAVIQVPLFVEPGSASAWTRARANTCAPRPEMRRSEQRRAAVIAALPARPHRPAAGRDARRATRRCSCARWRTRPPTAPRSSTR